MNPKIL